MQEKYDNLAGLNKVMTEKVEGYDELNDKYVKEMDLNWKLHN